MKIVRICLTTDDPPDMSGGEETEIRINRIILKAIVGQALPFYTQTLGLQEIEGWTYEDNRKDVGLQAAEIYIELQEEGWFKSGGFDSIGFEVDNLYNTVQKLENAGIDVGLGDADEHGWRWAFFKGPDNVNIVLGGLDQAISDEETDSQDEDMEKPNIGEKVRFWEEQDKINQALIPRVMEMHEVVTDLHKRTANISNQIAAAEARVLQQVQEEIKSQSDQELSGVTSHRSPRADLGCSRIRHHPLPMDHIAMQSANLLSELEQIPLRGEHERYTYEGMVKKSELMRNDLFAIEVAAGVEDTLSTCVRRTEYTRRLI